MLIDVFTQQPLAALPPPCILGDDGEQIKMIGRRFTFALAVLQAPLVNATKRQLNLFI